MSPVGLAIFGHCYASSRFSGVKPGMTQAKVERYLWALRGHGHGYNAVSPRGYCVAYEFLWFGKFTMIGVTYDANGVVDGSVPGFSN